jgi:O-antigen/teichoic acid export membrane protein
MLGRLFKHTSVYTVGNLLLTVAGLVSFPTFTRILSVGDYGILTLIGSTLTLLVACGKLGIQQSVVRFYAEMRAGRSGVTQRQFFSTVVFGMGAVSVIVTALWIPASQLLPTSLWNDPRIAHLLLWTAGLIVVRVVDSSLLNILRAQQNSVAFTVYSVARRYLGLGVTIATMFWILPGLDGFYASTVLVEAAATMILAWVLLRDQGIARSQFSPPLFRSMIGFGAPMIAFELGGIVLNVGDRYVIQAQVGAAALGVYSAAYALCEYVEAVLISSVEQAVTPMISRLWEEQGSSATRDFVEKIFHFYVIVAAAIVAGFAATGGTLLDLLASSRYSEGRVVIPLIIFGRVFYGALNLFAAGLYLSKRTRTLMSGVVICAFLNLALNLILVPRIGIAGAAWATVISSVLIAIGFQFAGRSTLEVRFPLRHALKCSAMALAMYVAVTHIELSNPVLGLAVKIACGALLYALLVLAFDRPSREAAVMLWARRPQLFRA